MSKFEEQKALVPPFGHTLGHCGIAVISDGMCSLYAGDAYYFRAELQDADPTVSQLARLRADDEMLRIQSLNIIRNPANLHPEVLIFGYHDLSEFPPLEL